MWPVWGANQLSLWLPTDAHIRTHRLPLGLGRDSNNFIMQGINRILGGYLDKCAIPLGSVPAALCVDETAITAWVEMLCASKDMKTCWLSGFCGRQPTVDGAGQAVPHVCLQGAVEFDLSEPDGLTRLRQLMSEHRTAHCKCCGVKGWVQRSPVPVPSHTAS